MDDKEKDFDVDNAGVGNDALLSDDIPLDGPSDFVDDEEAAEVSDKAELLSRDEEQKEENIIAEDTQSDDNASDGNTEGEANDDDTPVVDENVPLPDAEEMNEALKPKLKETSVKKKKRIIIAVVAAVLVVAITLGIALPIYFVNKDKIFVKSAEDFANYNDGTYFVLEKDVTVEGDLTIDRLYNIDLNGHTLVVNGTMTLTSGTEGTLVIGTKKGKEYIAKGLLQAQTLVIDTANADINLASSVTVNTMNVTAKTFTLSSFAQANGTVSVNARTVNVNGAIAFGEGADAKFVANNSDAVNVNANVSSAIELNYSTLNLAKNATVNSIALDNASRAAVYGVVTQSISTLAPAADEGSDEETAQPVAAANEEGTANYNIVVLLGTDFSCPVVSNIHTLAIERRTGLSINIYDCTQVKYIDRLSSPVDVNIDERSDGSLVAVSSKVQNAQGYSFRVDGGDWVDVETNEFDITAQLTSQTGSHRIEVFAKGNYSYSDPFALGDASVLYISGNPTACEYTYQIQLATPSNLNVTVNEGSYVLTFDKVAFATRYEYYVNGTMYTFAPTDDSATVSIDITDKLTTAGAYAIRVVAAADSADILTSKPAMTSTIKTEKLLTPALSAAQQEDGSVVLTIATTEGVSTTYIVNYTMTLEDGSKKSVSLVTTNTTVTLQGLNVGNTISVTAQACGYYTQSDPSATVVTAYVAPAPQQ